MRYPMCERRNSQASRDYNPTRRFRLYVLAPLAALCFGSLSGQATYVGAAACSNCHAAEYQKRSHEGHGPGCTRTSKNSCFPHAWAQRIEGVIDAASGLKANFISRADLIAAKLAAGRPQDIADAVAIRKAEESQR